MRRTETVMTYDQWERRFKRQVKRYVKRNRIKSDLLPEELTSELMDILMYQIEKKGCHKLRWNIAKFMLKEFC